MEDNVENNYGNENNIDILKGETEDTRLVAIRLIREMQQLKALAPNNLKECMAFLSDLETTDKEKKEKLSSFLKSKSDDPDKVDSFLNGFFARKNKAAEKQITSEDRILVENRDAYLQWLESKENKEITYSLLHYDEEEFFGSDLVDQHNVRTVTDRHKVNYGPILVLAMTVCPFAALIGPFMTFFQAVAPALLPLGKDIEEHAPVIDKVQAKKELNINDKLEMFRGFNPLNGNDGANPVGLKPSTTNNQVGR
jgi:hypothetical protein